MLGNRYLSLGGQTVFILLTFFLAIYTFPFLIHFYSLPIIYKIDPFAK